MDVKVRFLGGRKIEAKARGHVLITDQPSDNGGNDEGMTPPELFLSSVGACAAHYAAEYLRTRSLPQEELEIRVSGEKGDRPVRIVSLLIEVVAPGLTEKHRDGILRAVNACLIKNTLLTPPGIEVKLVSPAAAPEPVPVIG